MDNKNFDKAFEVFIESDEYDKAQNALLHYMKISFQAGWDAAGGEPLNPQDKFRLMRRNSENEPQK